MLAILFVSVYITSTQCVRPTSLSYPELLGKRPDAAEIISKPRCMQHEECSSEQLKIVRGPGVILVMIGITSVGRASLANECLFSYLDIIAS
jgi:hypothetical protein